MSRFKTLVRRLRQNLEKSGSQTFLVDFGSSQTKVMLEGKIVFSEASCIALHHHSKETVAVGNAASKLIGKTPPHIEVVFPVRRGKVVSVAAARAFTAAVFQPFLPQLLPFFTRRKKFVIAVSNLEQLTHQQTLKQTLQLISSSVTFQDSLTSIWRSQRRYKHLAGECCVINIGGMGTEMAIFAGGLPVVRKSWRVGGEDFTQRVIEATRKLHKCDIGWQTAERVKREIGRIKASEQSSKVLAVRGRDILSSLPVTCSLSSAIFQAGFFELSMKLIEGFHELCQECDPELLTKALEQGVFLTGGGSLLPGMSELFSQELKLDILSSPSPLEDVVRGMSA